MGDLALIVEVEGNGMDGNGRGCVGDLIAGSPAHLHLHVVHVVPAKSGKAALTGTFLRSLDTATKGWVLDVWHDRGNAEGELVDSLSEKVGDGGLLVDVKLGKGDGDFVVVVGRDFLHSVEVGPTGGESLHVERYDVLGRLHATPTQLGRHAVMVGSEGVERWGRGTATSLL